MGKLSDPRNMTPAVPGKKVGGVKPTGKLAGRSESPAVTTRTEAPMKNVSPAKILYPSSK